MGLAFKLFQGRDCCGTSKGVQEQCLVQSWPLGPSLALVVMVLGYSQYLSLNLAIKSSWSEPQSAPGLVFAPPCIVWKNLQIPHTV